MAGGRSTIGNAAKRQEVFEREKALKKLKKRDLKRKRQKELARDGGSIGDAKEEEAKKPRTLESTREVEPTSVTKEHLDDVIGDEGDDEFADLFVSGGTKAKIMISTRPRPSKELFSFIADLMTLIPNSFFYPRREFSLKQICSFASNKKFTHVIVLGEKNKTCNSLLLSHLPVGPTAYFKVSNVQCSSTVHQAGRKTDHASEVILNNFSTRLGRRVGRFLGSLFSHEPEFKGRQCVTFHTQRDYIFLRHHRYIFEENTKLLGSKDDGGKKKQQQSFPSGQKNEPVMARLQELGPRFTLRLRWLQEGTFDLKHGEFEWFHRRKEMDSSRRKFHL